MPARLFCEIGELAGSDFFIDREATIGRLQQNEISLHPTFISGEHARIYFDDEENGYVIEDLGSSNGTQVDGMDVTEPVRLDRLHVITFADQFDFVFQSLTEALARTLKAGVASAALAGDEGERTRVGDAFMPMPPLADAPPSTPPRADEKTPDEREKTHIGAFFGDLPSLPKEQDPTEKTRIEDAFPVAPPLAEADTDPVVEEPVAEEPVAEAEAAGESALFELEVTMPDGTQQVFALKDGDNVVGRESSRDIALLDSSISRAHARVTVRGEQVFLEDLDSKNGTFIEGQKLEEEIELLPETAVAFGREITARLRRRG